MDGIHDLGGRQGFGPIAVTDDDPAFPTEWEGRLYAISQTVGPEDMTIDWFRNLVELLEPKTYLNEPYFQKWLMVLLTSMVRSGMITKAEALGHGAESHAPPPPAQSVEELLAADQTHNTAYARPMDTAPAYETGQSVHTKRDMAACHTRLPQYARGRRGTVIAHHGAHVFPDANARGQEVAQHLYTVAFEATELWGDEGAPGDSVTLDLWESYFVRS